MEFIPLTSENIEALAPYLAKPEISFCDLSLGEKYMWRKEYKIDFAIIDDTLIMKETGEDYANSFYYPIGKNVEGALVEIEKHCRENFMPLEFCCIDQTVLEILKGRYFSVEERFDLDWNDYIYTAEQFKSYAGKKLSGQRNHVNKFKKTYPNYKFKVLGKDDIALAHALLEQYKKGCVHSQELLDEIEMCHDYLDNMHRLKQLGAMLWVNEKPIAMSIGEVVNDTLIVHVEKALTSYEGVYPTMASLFAKEFATDGVKFINREEDCGDLGLRQSKSQYKPIEIKNKYSVKVNTLLDKVDKKLYLETETLAITEILETDKQEYYKLYTDEELNKWWGYDYTEDLNGVQPTPDYFIAFQKSLIAKGEEISFAVRDNGKMVGELVLHNFDYFGGVEMGFRFFKECQGKGYAIKSATRLKEYVFSVLKAKTLKSRCFKENLPSAKLIKRLSLEKTSEDQTHYYFALTK